MPNYKKPTNHYDDNPSDEGEDYESPGVDMSDPRVPFDEDTFRGVANAAAAYQKAKKGGSRAEAADRLMED